MKSFIYSIAALCLVFTSGCKSYVKNPSFGGSFPDKTTTYTPTAISPAKAFSAMDSSFTLPITIQPKKHTYKSPIILSIKKKAPSLKKPKKDPKPGKLPVEKNAQAGFWIAIGAYFLPTLVQILVLAFGLELSPPILIVLGVLSFGGLITAFVLGLMGKRNINKEPNKYRGYGKAIAAIVIPAVILALSILYMLLFILLFAVILAIL